jgi:hypothetical protein
VVVEKSRNSQRHHDQLQHGIYIVSEVFADRRETQALQERGGQNVQPLFEARHARGWNSKSEIILPGAWSNQLDLSSHRLPPPLLFSFPFTLCNVRPFYFRALSHRAITRAMHQTSCQHTTCVFLFVVEPFGYRRQDS